MLSLEPLPMKEAEQFWADKVKLGMGEFNKLSREAKVRAFAISGIAKGQELETVFSALSKAISKGTSFGDFKKDCASIFEKRGWTGKRAWRVDNIFRTNIQTAYSVGRWKQIQAVKDEFSYLLYSAVNDTKTRPIHLALNNKVYPVDHPFWDTWTPINGYRCRCTTVPLNENLAKRMGYKVETDDPTNSLIEPIDPKTGNRMPAVQLLPDPGFGFNPGKVVWGGMVDSAQSRQSYKVMQNLPGPADYRRRALNNVRPASISGLSAGALLAEGLSDAEYKAKFVELYGEELVVKDKLSEPVILSLRSFQINKSQTGGVGAVAPEWKFHKRGHGAMIPLLQDVLENPYEIWLTPQVSESGQVRLTKRYVGLWKTTDKKKVAGLMVFEVERGVFKGVTAWVPKKKSGKMADLNYAERQRRGVLLYPGRRRTP